MPISIPNTCALIAGECCQKLQPVIRKNNNNKNIVFCFFYIFLLPFGLVMRLFGRDALDRASSPKDASYWRPVTRHTDDTTLPDMF